MSDKQNKRHFAFVAGLFKKKKSVNLVLQGYRITARCPPRTTQRHLASDNGSYKTEGS